MKRARRLLGAVSASFLMLAGLAVMATPAQAAHVHCGDVITTSTTLDSDVGPCSTDGLIVRGNNITLDLGGHRVFATNGPEETVGIRLDGVRGVTVRNGTVERFDAGVAIEGGSGNTVRDLTVRDNINDLQEPFDPTQPLTPQQMQQVLCIYGDGITTSDSSNNRIERNRVVNNGPYSGISLVGNSDGNIVQRNQVQDNNVPNVRPNGQNGLCGAVAPGSPGMSRGRTIQGIGIRIEGPGANGNQVLRNEVVNSALVGISVHSHVCTPPPNFETGPQDPNTNNLIQRNDVRRTGAETVDQDPFADGIALLAQGPIGRVTCAPFGNTVDRNRSTDNLRHGISLGRTTTDNTINGNVVDSNAVDGVRVFDGAVDNTLTRNRGRSNGEHDGHDDNANCDNNVWLQNRFATVNQPCVAARGGMGAVLGERAGAHSDDDAGPAPGRSRGRR